MDGKQVVLLGQPNVGKSTLFTRLTGVGVISSNYPGTTVEFDESTITRNGVTVHVHDVPGTYGLYGTSDDERVAIDMVCDSANDAVVVVVDATNMEGGLVLCMEVMELGIPVILALNKYDIATKKSEIDHELLSDLLGIPVIPISAKTAAGVDTLADAIAADEAKISDYAVRYDSHLCVYIDELLPSMPAGRFNSRGVAVRLLEGCDGFGDGVPSDVLDRISEMTDEFTRTHGETPDIHIARDRYAEAHVLVSKVQKLSDRPQTTAERISDLTIDPVTGVPILLAVIIATFAAMMYFGSLLDGVISWAYDNAVGSALPDFGRSVGGELGEAIMTGIDQSLQAILLLVIPYIMVFYIILGILEDTGYLPRAVVLLDRTMHRFGLHGGGFIPMMVGLGCNVPAIMATRSLRSKRERLILCTMIVMAVPCSAQLAIIFGVTSAYAGFAYTLGIFLMLLLLGIGIGLLLNNRLRYEPSELAMELPDLAAPSFRNVIYKMWSRIKDFIYLAVPLLIVSSIIVEILLTYGVFDYVVDPLSFITVGMLGLPAAVIVAFIVGVLRKEMALGMLMIIASAQGFASIGDYMTAEQLVVFAVVMSIYMPCLATLAAMGREIGVKETALVSFSSMIVALLIGAAVHGLFVVF